jgi:8-oxo-dGTP pyrophosphatase MutT (NUDIX family)
MIHALRRAGAWVGYRLIRAVWWFRRPVVLGVRVLVASEDRVLLVRHTYQHEWFLPGGTPDSGEPLATTARREAKEETGVEVGSLKLLGIYSTLSQLPSDHVAVFNRTLRHVSVARRNWCSERRDRKRSVGFTLASPRGRSRADAANYRGLATGDNWHVSGRGLIS